LDPVADAAIVALLRAWLGTLRTEAARAQQSADVIRMVNDLEVLADDVDDSPARPQARGIAGRFRPGYDQASQPPALCSGQLRRPALPPDSRHGVGKRAVKKVTIARLKFVWKTSRSKAGASRHIMGVLFANSALQETNAKWLASGTTM
jgi:hypothetical protein